MRLLRRVRDWWLAGVAILLTALLYWEPDETDN